MIRTERLTRRFNGVTAVDDLTLQDLRSTRAANATVWSGGSNERMIVRRVAIERAEPIEGRAPFYAQPSDGLHLVAGAAGPTVQDCRIVGTADDAIAVFSADPDRLMAGALIERNQIRDIHGRGIHITQSRDGICRTNRIARCVTSGIAIRSNEQATAASAVFDWQISANTLTQVWSSMYGAAISLTREAAGGLHDGIAIADNVFIDAPRHGNLVAVDAAAAVRIDRQVVRSFSTESNLVPAEVGDALVRVIAGTDVLGAGNILEAWTDRPTVVALRPGDTVDVRWSWHGSALPPGWTVGDVGSVRAAGSTTISDGQWTVRGSGADCWGRADACHFASQSIDGDVMISARLRSFSGADPWSKAGVMLRDGTAAGARHVSVFATPGNGIAFQRRTVAGAASEHTAGAKSGKSWVRIERSAGIVSGYESADGVAWTKLGSADLKLGTAAARIGLAVTAHNNGTLCTATFDHVELVTPTSAAQ